MGEAMEGREGRGKGEGDLVKVVEITRLVVVRCKEVFHVDLLATACRTTTMTVLQRRIPGFTALGVAGTVCDLAQFDARRCDVGAVSQRSQDLLAAPG